MSINLNKSWCLRDGPRNNIICDADTSLTGHKLPWVSEMRSLGVYFVQSRSLKCSLYNAKRGFYRAANIIFGKIGRIASEEVIIQLILSKYLPILMSVPNLKRITLFVQKLLGGGRNFEIWSRELGHAHLGDVLWSVSSSGPSSMSVPNLKQISLYVPKLLGSQNFEIWSRDLGHAHLGVVLWSGRSRGPSSMSLPNLKQISLYVQKL